LYPIVFEQLPGTIQITTHGYKLQVISSNPRTPNKVRIALIFPEMRIAEPIRVIYCMSKKCFDLICYFTGCVMCLFCTKSESVGGGGGGAGGGE
jgi:hypothetical protein